jgi:hypothetical protein
MNFLENKREMEVSVNSRKVGEKAKSWEMSEMIYFWNKK